MSESSTIDFTVVIPARFQSSRLPGKPLELIAGEPMIVHVYRQALQSSASRVVVATDDQRIYDVILEVGGEACMTSENHESGTDRIQEVADKLNLANDHIVVNVQGDEPLIPPAVIDQVAENLATHSSASAATLCHEIDNIDEFKDPNAVKVVFDKQGMALYFTRACAPWPRDTFSQTQDVLPIQKAFFRHVGIYAYKVSLLHEFKTWPMATMESLECLEQLRILWNGHRIHVAPACEVVAGGVDTPEDLARVKSIIEEG